MGLHSWSLFLFGTVLFAAWAGLVLSAEGLNTSSSIISADELEEDSVQVSGSAVLAYADPALDPAEDDGQKNKTVVIHVNDEDHVGCSAVDRPSPVVLVLLS